jgi:hypothetical protein
MAKSSGLGDNFFVAGVDVSGDIASINRVGGGNTPLDMTDITLSAMARQGGKRDGAMDFVSFFDPAANASHATFSALPTADEIVTYLRGTIAGNPCANLNAKQINYDGNRADDGSFLLNVSAQGNLFGLEWATQLTAGKVSQGVAGNVTSVDLGAVSPGSFGVQMYYHLLAFTGTSITLKLQDSTDNGAGDAFADVASVTTSALTTAPQAGRIAVAANSVDRFVRVVSVGTFSAATFQVSLVRNPVLVSF